MLSHKLGFRNTRFNKRFAWRSLRSVLSSNMRDESVDSQNRQLNLGTGSLQFKESATLL